MYHGASIPLFNIPTCIALYFNYFFIPVSSAEPIQLWESELESILAWASSTEFLSGSSLQTKNIFTGNDAQVNITQLDSQILPPTPPSWIWSSSG